jgi:hypothetical protein
MSKQHETIPNEPAEKPVLNERPEVSRPIDPDQPAIPHEDDDHIPNELPPSKAPGEDAPVNQNNF